MDIHFIYNTSLTWHKVKKKSRDGIKRRTVGNIGTSVSQHRYNPVRNAPAFSRQVVRQAMSTVHEWW